MIPPSTISPPSIGTCPDTKSQPSAFTARAKGRCWPPVPVPPAAPYLSIVLTLPPWNGVSVVTSVDRASRQEPSSALPRRHLAAAGEDAVDPHGRDPLGGLLRV